MKKSILPVVLTAVVTSVLTLLGFNYFTEKPVFSFVSGKPQVHYVANNGMAGTQPVDFAPAAESSVKSVVHIKTLTQGKTVIANDPYDPWSQFLGPRRYNIPGQMGSGSGVIISPDGYIVTNNHVVAGADEVQVTFNTRNQQMAKVIGTDPSTDLAVLKIDGSDLPYMTLGNSDQIQLGQWVLAVGYPLNLDATVTAGIVSAKSRSIGINRNNNSAVESFIQTDAAVNPGNSGGALVNTNGQLIGINAAIASPTGSYAGYSYAIPSNLVQKVVNDLIKFGDVKRGFIGVQLLNLNEMDKAAASKLGISEEDFNNTTGVYVNEVTENGGAEKAGIRKGDFITAINGMNVNSTPALMEQLARFHPGDKVTISYSRSGKTRDAVVELKAAPGGIAAVDTKGTLQLMGATFRNLSASESAKYKVNGAMVTATGNGILARNTPIRPGFVITRLNGNDINKVSDLQDALTQASGERIEIGGMYPGKSGMYYYGFPYDDDAGDGL